ncbi:MAG: S41 family peptidase [Opitutaceae bacterium]|nr:S41 family peptidase [Cytophagales bacterium]
MTNKKTRWITIGSIIVSISALFSFTNANDKYFEIAKNLDIFATLFKEVNSFYVDEVEPNKFIKTGIDAMLESLDPYTNYIPEDEIEDYRTITTGQYGGIGAVIGKKNTKTIILMPYENFPAHKAGLKIGDELLEVDGVDLKDKNTNEVSKLLKGAANTEVNVTIKRFGVKDKMVVQLKREKIKVENVPYYGMLNNEVGYIHLTDFTASASKDIKNALQKLKDQGAKKLVFDLRDNPGGLLNEAIAISNIFIQKDKEIVSTKGKVSEWNKVYMSLDAPFDTEMPLVVLTSSRSASASEIVAGVIQDYDRGVLIGQRTFGKGLVQATRPLSYNSQLKITTAKYYIPSGRCIQAIDYSHRKEDGTVSKFADSLRKEFKTGNQRKVYDGGGITPDVELERMMFAPITNSLGEKSLIFDYATIYASEHKSIAPAKEFKISDDEYNKFLEYLKGKDYDYATKVEGNIDDLIKNAKKEKFYDGVKDKIDALKKEIQHDKDKDVIKFKDEIKQVLESDIVSRYYLHKGNIEYSFNHDVDVKEALRLFSNMEEYNKILKGTK